LEWDKSKTENEKKLSMGSLMMWAKECNPEENFKIQEYGISKIINDYTDEGLGQIVVNEMGQDLIYQDNDLYNIKMILGLKIMMNYVKVYLQIY